MTHVCRKARPRSKHKGASTSSDKQVWRLREAGRSAIVGGNLVAAEKAYTQAVALGARDADVYNNLATIYSKSGVRIEEQIGLLEKAYELGPENAEIRKNFLGILGRQAGSFTKVDRYREALPLFLRKVQIEPEAASNHRELGCCYSKTGGSRQCSQGVHKGSQSRSQQSRVLQRPRACLL